MEFRGNDKEEQWASTTESSGRTEEKNTSRENIFTTMRDFTEKADPYLEEDFSRSGTNGCRHVTPGLNPGLFMNNGFVDERTFEQLKSMENLLLRKARMSRKLKRLSKRKRAQKLKRKRSKKEGKKKMNSTVQVWMDLDDGKSWMLL